VERSIGITDLADQRSRSIRTSEELSLTVLTTATRGIGSDYMLFVELRKKFVGQVERGRWNLLDVDTRCAEQMAQTSALCRLRWPTPSRAQHMAGRCGKVTTNDYLSLDVTPTQCYLRNWPTETVAQCSLTNWIFSLKPRCVPMEPAI